MLLSEVFHKIESSQAVYRAPHLVNNQQHSTTDSIILFKHGEQTNEAKVDTNHAWIGYISLRKISLGIANFTT